MVVAAAIAVPLAMSADDDQATETTAAQTTSTAVSTTTASTTGSSTTISSSSSTSIPTSTTTAPGAPGDSTGEWVEMDLAGVPSPAWAVCVSDQALIADVETGDGYALYAYLFDPGMAVELPIDASEFYGEDIDELLAVWWEGDYDEDLGRYYNEHIYAFRLPDGPKVEVAAREGMSYPRVAGDWITWVEGEPWEENPDEYWLLHVYGVRIDPDGTPLGEPVELVSSATAFALGDSVWTYDLSPTHLAWEQAAPVDVFDAGSYTMDLSTMRPLVVGNEVWRPSLGDGNVVYYQDGLKIADLVTRRVREIDPLGDFPTAARTFVAYFRSAAETDGGSSYEIVARGYNGNHEQVLGRQYDPPWLSPLIAASDNRVAFAVDGVPHMFEWQGR
ncbi:MAG: hypothetical protein LLG45_01095 [Actinomycetia bacterium]|nr:hypothetical protein [Actinomycetes bacterium]